MTARTITAPRDQTAAPKLHPDVLGRYLARSGAERQLRCLHLSDGSRLVVDWRSDARADARLVGALASDEPRENARVLAELYLADTNRGRCRRLCRSDLSGAQGPEPDATAKPSEPLRDDAGVSYAISAVRCGKPYRELRWTRCAPGETDEQPLCLRELLAEMQAYEPARSLTVHAIARHEDDASVSVCRLRAELQRLDASPIVLNTRLREAVLRRAASGDSLSQIALRCGRVKRHAEGHVSGETSWLGRRIGLLPEGGCAEPTRWVHSEVLALIARQGLDLCPAEVEAA
ncbi:MAG TPA: hypothetical protein VK605_04090 [Solirubrobacteraceae bacterium]|nr:hypothetical protein [Solirubrobacteraceae bacterium]